MGLGVLTYWSASTFCVSALERWLVITFDHLETLSEGLLFSMLSDTPLVSLYSKSFCVRTCACFHPASISGRAHPCVRVWERETPRPLFYLLQVRTVYIDVNTLSPVHVRATVNKQKLVLLIKALAVMTSSFSLFAFLIGRLGCVKSASVGP